MPAVQPLKRNAQRTLWFLEGEAWGGHGWWRRGVRGWRFRSEIEAATSSRLPEVLPGLWARGYVDRTTVVDPGRKTPIYLYRISTAGVTYLGEAAGTPRPQKVAEPFPEDDDPDAGSLYLPVHPWHALDLLRRHTAHWIGPERFGQAGWMTPAEMRPRLRGVLGENMPWLLSRGLVERRHGAGALGPRPPWFYRASAFGLQLELVDTVAVGSDPPQFVQVRPVGPTGPVR